MTGHGMEAFHWFCQQYGNDRPMKICSAELVGMRRSRFFWCDWAVKGGLGVRRNEKEHWTQVTLEGPGAKALAAPASQVQRFSGCEGIPFATLMAAETRKVPRTRPIGIQDCEKADLERWADDCFMAPAYHYREANIETYQIG